jgi:hypothetical protein
LCPTLPSIAPALLTICDFRTARCTGW